MASSALHSSRSSQWFTPPELLEREREALGGDFDFDPASCAQAQRLVRADVWHDGYANGDGLREPWRARRMHLNGPYSRKDGGPITRWIERALLVHLGELDEQFLERGTMVVNATPGPRWSRWLFQVATIAYLDDRVPFIETVDQALARWVEARAEKKLKTSAAARAERAEQLLERGTRARLPQGLVIGPAPTHWTAIAYVGDEPERFARAFSSVATIIPAGSARVSETTAP